MNIPKNILFQEVLNWCNELRKQRGIEPPLDSLPKGLQRDGYSCPCGAATGVFVGCAEWAPTKEDHIAYRSCEPTPECVKEFVPRFDEGEFPELVDGPVL